MAGLLGCLQLGSPQLTDSKDSEDSGIQGFRDSKDERFTISDE
jgi:hypothetical protein